MPQTKNLALVFRQVPQTFPEPGKDLVVEDISIDLDADLPTNSILLEHLYNSVDPYMRGRLRDPKIKSYAPPFALGKPMDGGCIARVIKSTSDEHKEGDLVIGGLPIQQYSVLSLNRENNATSLPPVRKLSNPAGLSDLRYFLGPLGMPGLTAYSSFYDIGKPKKGETIFVSSAAGAVGQLVGQLAKHEGLTVIGSVGSDEKLDFITKELGFDAGFNYKKESPFDALKRLAPDGIDIYYENVGGEHLAAAIDSMHDFGRIVACGMIGDYNTPYDERYGVKNLFNIVAKRLTIRGFIVGDANMGPNYFMDHQKNFGTWLKDGSFKAKVDELPIDKADEAMVGVLKGKNFGKMVVNMQPGKN